MFRISLNHAKQEWKKTGDFKAMMSAYQHGGISEVVKYTNLAKNSALKEVELHCEHPGEFRVWLTIDKNRYQEVEQYLAACGFPKELGSMRHHRIHVTQIPNTQYLTAFLNALKHFETGIDDIAHEIISNVKPHMNHDQSIPGWLKEGGILNHPYESYISTSNDSKIAKLSMEQNIATGAIKLSVTAKKYAFDEISDKLKAQGIPSSDFGSIRLLSMLSYPIHSKDEFEKTLQALAKVDKTVAPMIDSMIYSYTHMKPFQPRMPYSMGAPMMMGGLIDIPLFNKPFYWPTKPVPPKLSEKDIKELDDVILKLLAQHEAGKINLNQPTPRVPSNVFGKSSLFATSIHEEPTIDPTPSDDDRFKFPTIRHY